MYYALVYNLTSYPESLGIFREKFDSHAEFVPPHITIMFPVESSIGNTQLSEHIAIVLKRWKKFSVMLDGDVLSWDNSVFLTVGNGKEQLVKLHQDLYTGRLASYLNVGVKFIPHIKIGTANNGNIGQLLDEAGRLHINQEIVIDKLLLISFESDDSPNKLEKIFLLQS